MSFEVVVPGKDLGAVRAAALGSVAPAVHDALVSQEDIASGKPFLAPNALDAFVRWRWPAVSARWWRPVGLRWPGLASP